MDKTANFALAAFAASFFAAPGVNAQSYYVPTYGYGPINMNQQLNLELRQKIESKTEVNIDMPAPKITVRPEVNVNIEQPDYGLWGPGSWMQLAVTDHSKSYQCLKSQICGYQIWGNTDTLKKVGNSAFINIKIACLKSSGKRWFCAGDPSDHSGGRPLRFNCKSNQLWDSKTARWISLNPSMATIHSFVCA